MHGLRELRVIDLSTGIAGAYATKLFADAWADVVKVEPAGGDPLRRWSATRGELPESEDGALFRFLHTSKRSVVGTPAAPEVVELIAAADLVVESFPPSASPARDWCERYPGLVVLSITPFGHDGPYAERPWTEFTVQAECGSIASRGLPEQPPIMAGAKITEWVGGTFAAVAALAAVSRARRSGQGEHVDFSLLEVMNVASGIYSDLMSSLAGRPLPNLPGRRVELPSIEPTKDGWVGFATNSAQQYQDFLLLIERLDWKDDAELASSVGRWARREEWNRAVRGWTRSHTTAEIVEKASLLRIPIAPVNHAASVLEHEQFRARNVFISNPGGFLQPRPPYLMDGEGPRPLEPAPALGEHSGQVELNKRKRRARGTTPSGAANAALPLEGIRVLDATAWWAGPSATHMLATLGADVIHLEAAQHPDGMRLYGDPFMADDWWEYSSIFLGTNTNKRGLTLNLADARGLELCRKLVSCCDVFVENYSPRVVEQFGLGWEGVQALNPRIIMVRMAAFGLSGPWRDYVAFAQTMEQMTGLAWVTGHVDDQPRIQRGPCDPLAGMHAAFATLVALEERERTGRGQLLECTMVEGALNAAAEQIVEYSAYGIQLERDGNRCQECAPQGVYACTGVEQWLALSVASDAQWQALVRALGLPTWAMDPSLDTRAGRRDSHDVIDRELSTWASDRDLAETVEMLLAHGVPAAPVLDGREIYRHPQLTSRGFLEPFDHPAVGRHVVATVPFRYATREHWLRSPAPMLGQHNREILSQLLGLSDAEIDALEEAEVIGTRPTNL